MSAADEIRELLCSDDPGDQQRARELAAGDPALAEIVREHERLMAAIDGWKATTRAPAELRDRIVAAAEVAADSQADVVPLADARRRRVPSWSWRAALAAAAGLVVVILVARPFPGGPAVVSTSGRLLVADALEAAHEAEQRHAEAIAMLEQAAAPVLALADDPNTAAADAAMLLAYRDRIAAIDTAIAEVRSYLEENPGLASARTVLLAAYIDKTRALEEILEIEPTGERG